MGRSQFFKKLSTPIQEQLCHVLEHDIGKFSKFDEEKGYAVMEDDDSFIEAKEERKYMPVVNKISWITSCRQW